ncbi:DUF1697 domain-containing protein [Paenibacillus endoradicis]|uniref:DUF1697 domain-containing protein n=1 Tax=Paenibacillus endoradicis TaxID=2972487 RepID=UPI002159270F|nr:DUF1697 domain-containing protein [Paenibacillus endoradicis]MCR8659833.1 DUF1697 domain-containing protein [Paenibacillus endoradicis]
MTQYIVLLRGINVGGKNKLKMADLRVALSNIGLVKVQTYIQSGNIVLESNEDEATLCSMIEHTIEKEFKLSIKTVIRTSEQLKQIVKNCPFSEEQIAEVAANSETETLYVAMLLDEPHFERIEKLNGLHFGNDQYGIVGRDVYLLFDQSIRNSKLAVQVEKLGEPITTRNWKTINKLIELCNELE